jgi:hypothetical protein
MIASQQGSNEPISPGPTHYQGTIEVSFMTINFRVMLFVVKLITIFTPSAVSSVVSCLRIVHSQIVSISTPVHQKALTEP